MKGGARRGGPRFRGAFALSSEFRESVLKLDAPYNNRVNARIAQLYAFGPIAGISHMNHKTTTVSQ